MLKYLIFVMILLHLSMHSTADTSVEINFLDPFGSVCCSALNILVWFLGTWQRKEMEPKYPSSCRAYNYSSDIHEIHVPGIPPFEVLCDSQMAGPGWTVALRRIDASDYFGRNWTEYKQGFGNLNGSFFIGLKRLHLMTQASAQELYLYIKEDGQELFGKWLDFRVGNEGEGYALRSITHRMGNIYDFFKGQVNVTFATYDRENYFADYYKPAYVNRGGWWYSNTNILSPTRLYYNREFVQMMIRDQT